MLSDCGHVGQNRLEKLPWGLHKRKGFPVKKAFLTAIIVGLMTPTWGSLAHADGSSCTATVAEKKLAGAAKTSFMKKCETDAQNGCDATAMDKKLFGAAKTSFTKKCVTDAVGS